MFIKRLLILFAACEFAVYVHGEGTASYSVVPLPQEIKLSQDNPFRLDDKVVVVYPESNPQLRRNAEFLSEYIGQSVGFVLPVKAMAGGEKVENAIVLALTPQISNKEGYQLSVSSKGILIEGQTEKGVFYGIQTLRKSIPIGIGEKMALMPTGIVKDEPRFVYRGMHLDVARHFFTVEFVKKYIDLLALHNMNTFHWHLTDDQGWRIEIKQYPLLTAKGAWRKFNSHDRECMHRMVEEDNLDFRIPEDKMEIVEGDTLYGGYYTQDDIKEIVAYAAQRGIDVIPEIDMPGHFLAAINQYPEIACTGLIGWGSVFSSPICPGKDSTLEFCKNVYKEVFQLFPYMYVHMGGDEVDMANWKKCADCQRRMKREGIQSENGLQAWFVRQMETFFMENGKKFIGWDEVIADGLSDNATIMWWRSWAPKAIPTATSEGKQVINTENNYFYFDYLQDKTTLPKLLAYEPIPAELTPEQQKRVLGVQANFWCEWIPSRERMQYMAAPRMLAIAELGWSDPKQKDWDGFKNRLSDQFERLNVMNVNYRIPDLEGFYKTNVFIGEGEVKISCMDPSAEIHYTTDGSVPTLNSPKYDGNLKVTETTEFTFRTFRANGKPCDTFTTKFIKGEFSPASSETPAGKGLEAVWYDFKGNKCADIDKASRKGSYNVTEVSIPAEAKGNIGLVIKGFINVPEDGIYTFALTSDDGSTLVIDGDPVIDNDGPHGPREVIGQKALAKGYHPIEVRYFDSNGGMLKMEVRDSKENVIPVDGLFAK